MTGIVLGVLGIVAVVRAISWLDDWLDRRTQQRAEQRTAAAALAVIAEAEHHTRTAATNSRTDKDQT